MRIAGRTANSGLSDVLTGPRGPTAARGEALMWAPALSAVRRETKTLNRVGAGASRRLGGTPGMRESLRFPTSCDRICQHALSFIRVVPVVGLAVWFCSASGAQDVRPAPSENARAPAVDTVGPNSGASGGTPVSVAPAGSPTVV